LVLSLLVFVHELGHFLAAKWRKVAVEECNREIQEIGKEKEEEILKI
jgi:hypothetical protein